jgi:hypothetical protein
MKGCITVRTVTEELWLYSMSRLYSLTVGKSIKKELRGTPRLYLRALSLDRVCDNHKGTNGFTKVLSQDFTGYKVHNN